jgi:hypothetical protein
MPITTPFPQIFTSLWLLIPLMIWDLAWRGTALWKASHRNQLSWFIALLIFNTMGILPIIYLLYVKFSSKPKATIS